MRRLVLFAVLALVPAEAATIAPVGLAAESSAFAVLAVTPDGGTAADVDGRHRVPLPWLLPGDRDLDVTRDGRRVVFVSERDGNPELYVAQVSGGPALRLTKSPTAADRAPVWSPNGKRIAWESTVAGRTNVFTMAADGSRQRRLVFGGGHITSPEWSPDGRQVAFGSDRDGFPGLWSVSSGGGEPVLLHHVGRTVDRIAWHPDGGTIVVGSRGDLFALDIGTSVLSVLVGGPAADGEPDWSPDGTRLVFARASRGERELLTVVVDGGERGEPVRFAGSAGHRSPRFVRSTPWLLPPRDALLPDLDQRPPTDLAVTKVDGRFRLGFTSNVENVGEGALVIHGRRPASVREMVATQLVERASGGAIRFTPVGELAYEPHAPHSHWHLEPFERYELHSLRQPGVVVRDRKSGFCLIDRWGRAARVVKKQRKPRFIGDCATGRPEATQVVQGSSPGYRDRYPAFFHGQDVEIQGLPEGRYVLVHRANPERLLREADYTDNEASALIELSWPRGRAQPPAVRVLRMCETGADCSPPR